MCLPLLTNPYLSSLAPDVVLGEVRVEVLVEGGALAAVVVDKVVNLLLERALHDLPFARTKLCQSQFQSAFPLCSLRESAPRHPE